jgi:hypothetical protein
VGIATVSIGDLLRFTARAERWWNRRSRSAKLICVLSALAIAIASSGAFGFLVAKRLERADRRDSFSERAWASKPGSPVAIRYLSSGLLDLKLASFHLPRLDPEFKSYAGAIQLLDDGILIAEATGGFYGRVGIRQWRGGPRQAPNPVGTLATRG